MGKVQYKADKGVLHIGGGRFFHAKTPKEVENKADLLSKFVDLEDAGGDEQTNNPENGGGQGSENNENPDKHTESSLKKLNADEQKALIEELGGNVEETSNQDDRIALILQLQEDGQEEGE
ncbi:hypothetical protein WMZ97_13200 [Lentibacillus sp. N15]|uniref:hypothetical protein n=1 Tax=Lentibacillus songyuanensis TaxID=3136161 RepID=UPI0031B9BDD3